MPITPKEISSYLLKNNFLLTALEFFEELREINVSEPILTQFFLEHKYKNIRNGTLKSKVPPTKELKIKEFEEKIALLEYKLRMAEKENGRLKAQVKSQFLEKDNKTFFVESESVNQNESEEKKTTKNDESKIEIKKRERRSTSLLKDSFEVMDMNEPSQIKNEGVLKKVKDKHIENLNIQKIHDLKSKSLGKFARGGSPISPKESNNKHKQNKERRKEFDDIMSRKMNQEETQVLNFMIQTYLREENYKLTLITFFDEVGSNEIVNLDNILSSKYGLLFLYRYFLYSKPNANSIENEYERNIDMLKSQLKKYKSKLKERKSKIEKLLKERDHLKVMLDCISSTIPKEEKEEESSIKDKEKKKKEEVTKIQKNVEIKVKKKDKKKKKKRKLSKSEFSLSQINFTSKIINEIFHVLPGIIRNMKFQKRELLINLIKLLLCMNHPKRNNISLFSLLKRPSIEQRYMIVNALYDLYTVHNDDNENTIYFNMKVFKKIKKSVSSKYFEKKILTCDFVVRFYPLFSFNSMHCNMEQQNDQERLRREEDFFRILKKLSYDFNFEVRVSVLRGICELIKIRAFTLQKHADSLTDILLKFLREEETPDVLKIFFDKAMLAILSWFHEESKLEKKIEKNKKVKAQQHQPRILNICDIVINEIGKNCTKKIGNYANGFCILLTFLKSAIPNVSSQVINKSLRSVYFKWLLDKGISKIINLIISQDSSDLPKQNCIDLITILRNFNHVFGKEFHERILKKGFLLLLNNDNAAKADLLRIRLYPFFLISICNEDERKYFFERMLINVIEKKKKNYSEQIVRKIITQMIGFYDFLYDDHNNGNEDDNISEGAEGFAISMVEMCDEIYFKYRKSNKEMTIILLDVLLPIFIPTLRTKVLESKVIELLTKIVEYKKDGGVITGKVLKNLGTTMVQLNVNEKKDENNSDDVDEEEKKQMEEEKEKSEKEVERILNFFKYFTTFSEKSNVKMDGTENEEGIKEQLNLILDIFNILSNIVRKRIFIYEICDIVFNFSNNSLLNVREVNGDYAKQMCKSIVIIYKVIARFNSFERKTEVIKSMIIPNLNTMVSLFKDDNEYKKNVKGLLKTMKKKVRKNLFSISKDDKLKFAKLNIFKKKTSTSK